MPRMKAGSVPGYRLHRASCQGIVTLNSRDFYLGPFSDPASKQRYHETIGVWLANGRRPLGPDRRPLPDDHPDQVRPVPVQQALTGQAESLTVSELVLAFVEHLRKSYPNPDDQAGVPASYKRTLRRLRKSYGRLLAANFGPKLLKQFREELVAEGLVRTSVNAHIGRVRAMFRWGTEEEILPPSTYHALAAVVNLRRGRSAAKEGKRVLPADPDDVEKTLAHLPGILADVVRLQLLLGCRPGELLTMKPAHVDRTGQVWTYRPPNHKTAHHGKSRSICVGPNAQLLLEPYLQRAPDSPCFSAKESDEQRRLLRHQQRKTPLEYGNKPGSRKTAHRRRPPGATYSTASYRRAITRACVAAGVKPWNPHQLRHLRATVIRRTFDLDSAAAVLGHSNLNVTQIYAELTEEKAAEVARQIG